jgi:hypothetical protein
LPAHPEPLWLAGVSAGEGRPDARIARLRRIGGYGGAIAVTPYLLIKVAWTFGLLLPTDDMGSASWRAINATTALLAAAEHPLAQALAAQAGTTLSLLMGATLLLVLHDRRRALRQHRDTIS